VNLSHILKFRIFGCDKIELFYIEREVKDKETDRKVKPSRLPCVFFMADDSWVCLLFGLGPNGRNGYVNFWWGTTDVSTVSLDVKYWWRAFNTIKRTIKVKNSSGRPVQAIT
jgi:hypothetical protein